MQAGTELSHNGLKIIIHKEMEDFYLEECIISNPKTSQSGNWEVWQLDREGEEQAEKFEDVHLVPSDKLLEIQTQESLEEGSVYDILSALQIGFDAGDSSGANRIKRSVKYSLAVLTGEIDDSIDLDEAAYQYERRQKE